MIRKMSVLQRLMLLKMASGGGSLTEYEATGNPAAFNTNVAKPLKQLLIPFAPVQAEGTPSPENPLPITGWTGVNVTRTGVNLLPKATGYNHNGLTNTVNNDNSISISGTATGTGGYITDWINLPCKIKKGTVFTIGTTTNIPASKLRFFPDEGSIDVGNGTNYKTVTASIDITKFRLYLFTTANEAYNFTIYPQIELGSSASPYEEYVGTTIPVTFPAMGCNLFDGILADGGIGSDGQDVTTSSFIRSVNYISVYPGQKIHIVYVSPNSGANMRIYCYDADKTYKSNIWKPANADYTIPDDTYFIRFYMDSSYKNASSREISINYPATVTEYEPYTNTAYGGTLDLTTGVLTVEYGWFTDDGQDVNKWSAGESSGMLRVILSAYNIGRLPKANSTDNLRVNYFKATGSTQEWSAFIGSTSNFLAYIPLTVCQNKDAWLAYLAEHPLQICYELAEPIEYQLTPQQITTLIGDNVIFTSTNGQNTVKYLKRG